MVVLVVVDKAVVVVNDDSGEGKVAIVGEA